MKKKLIIAIMGLTLMCVGCGSTVSEVPTDETMEEVIVEEPEIIEEPEVIIEEPEVEEDKSVEDILDVVEVVGEYQNVFTFAEYNEAEPDRVVQFNCPTTVTKEETVEFDTKKIVYTAVFDIRDWSLEFDHYASITAVVEASSGERMVYAAEDLGFVEYSYEEEYDENYTTHTKKWTITCPVEYNDYGLYISDYYDVMLEYKNITELKDIEVNNRVFLK